MRFGRVEVTGGFLLLAAWMNYLDQQMIVPASMLACLIHELGHLAAIRRVGGRVTSVRLTVIGAELVLKRPLGYWQEGVAALAGPGANFAAALLFSHWPWGSLFSGLNLVMGCFNLMPIGQLDGGRALRCTLAPVIGLDWTQRISSGMDVFFTVMLLGLGGILTAELGNITLLVVALWLFAVLCKGQKVQD